MVASSSVAFKDAEVVREFATSKDGTRVPVNIIRRKGTKLDGTNPTLLYGYGGYGSSESPCFLGSLARIWLDQGGVYVIANLRGGGEYGEDWHRAGNLTHKQNVFDDFIGAAEYLIKTQLHFARTSGDYGRQQRWTAHGRSAYSAPRPLPSSSFGGRNLRHAAG